MQDCLGVKQSGLNKCAIQGLHECTTEGLYIRTGVTQVPSSEQTKLEPSVKTERKTVKERKVYSPDSLPYQLSELLLQKILEHLPGYKKPDINKWALHMDALMRLDKRPPEEVKAVILFAQRDPFWRANILSVDKLRKQYDQFNSRRLQMRASPAYQKRQLENMSGEEADEYKDFSSEENRFRAVWASCGIPPRLVHASFTNYKPACPEKEMALHKCQAFVQKGLDLIKQGNGLFFQGPVGTGKSHLAVASLRAILENNIDSFGTPSSDNQICGEPVYDGLCCSMISVVDLLSTLRESINIDNSRVPARRILHRARTDAIVILDDIGAEKPSEWVEEQLYGLIDLRYRMQRSTFFTTNCTLKQLESQIGSRIVSRIFEMCEGVKVSGQDWGKNV